MLLQLLKSLEWDEAVSLQILVKAGDDPSLRL
jgi:hypothetical protein